MNRNGYKGVTLHGEGGEVDPAKAEVSMEGFRGKLCEIRKEKKATIQRVYNGDQYALFHQKLPSRMILSKLNRKTARGSKLMRDKNRVSIMAYVSCVGHKIRFAIIGKAEKPRCFKLLKKNENTPITYKD